MSFALGYALIVGLVADWLVIRSGIDSYRHDAVLCAGAHWWTNGPAVLIGLMGLPFGIRALIKRNRRSKVSLLLVGTAIALNVAPWPLSKGIDHYIEHARHQPIVDCSD